MKAFELRIGNWILWQRRPYQIRSTIELYYISTDEINSEPIPLTEEWLIKFGFENSRNIRKSDSFYFINVGGSECHINPNNGVVWIERYANIFNVPQLIEYVHQLQNLYFALTGEELTIKEP